MNQRIDLPTPDDLSRIEAQRKWVREHFTPETQHQYETLEGKLRLLDTIIRSKWIEPSETVKLQCLGIALGDAFVQKLGLTWVMVEDDYGRDPAVRVAGSNLLFPLTMISKRIERGEEVDVYAIFEGVCAHAQRMRGTGA